MRAVRFVISGKLAHFRRFYTNSSSLSYPLPPPPTLRGILGAALGLGPEYAGRFRDWRFSVRPLAPWRFLMQTVNHLMIKKGTPTRNLAGGEHTQVPVQLIVPRKPEGRVRYEVLALGDDPDPVIQALAQPRYPLSLGPAFALAFVEEAGWIEGEIREAASGPLLGAFEITKVRRFLGRGRILHDRYPLRLDEERNLLAVADLGIEADGEPIALDYAGPVFATATRLWALEG